MTDNDVQDKLLTGRLAHWERSISAAADRVADFMRRRKFLILFLFSGLYFFVTIFRASRKLFWFDELFTVYLSRLPDMGSVWGALKQGVDFNPPLFYALTRFSESLFGEGHIATRLPAIVGFWIFCLCLFQFVSVRTSVLAGTIAMLFPMVTTAYFYAYEARAHGVVLGFGGIALVCWQASIRSRRRTWWLTGLSAALLYGVATHTYAILLVVPFALAEFVRTLSRRRIDWILWLAIVAPLSGALLSLPLFRASKIALPGIFVARLHLMVDAYQFHLAPAASVLSAALVLYFLFNFAPVSPPAAPDRAPSLKLPEVVVLISFVAMPFFSFVVARLTGAPFLSRYSISTIAGFGCLLGIVMAKRSPVGLGVLFLLLVQIGFRLLDYAHTGTIEPTTSLTLAPMSALTNKYEAMRAIPNKKLPIVLLDDLEFLPIIHYAPPDIASRLVYSEPETDINGPGYTRLQRCCRAPGRLEKLSNFLSTHQAFILLCSTGSLYRLHAFRDDGADIKFESVSSNNLLFSVTSRKSRGESVAIPLK